MTRPSPSGNGRQARIRDADNDAAVSVLHRDEVLKRLQALPDWHHRGNAIEKRFDCEHFDGSMRFANAVAEVANLQDHHPDIAISWNDVTMTLSSHDLGGLTERDFRLAAAIDEIYARKS